MVSPLAKRFFYCFTIVTVVSIHGQTTIRTKAFDATVEFRLKITLAPHWPVRSKIVEAAPGTNIRPSHSPSPFILSGRYAERSIVPEYVERIHKIMRDRHILRPDTSPKK